LFVKCHLKLHITLLQRHASENNLPKVAV